MSVQHDAEVEKAIYEIWRRQGEEWRILLDEVMKEVKYRLQRRRKKK